MPTIRILDLVRMLDSLLPNMQAENEAGKVVIGEIMRRINERRDFNQEEKQRLLEHKAGVTAGLTGWRAWWYRHLLLLRLVAAAAIVTIVLCAMVMANYSGTLLARIAFGLSFALAILLTIMLIMRDEYKGVLESPDEICAQECDRCDNKAVTASGLCEDCFQKDLELQKEFLGECREAIRLATQDEELTGQVVAQIGNYPKLIPSSLQQEVEMAVARLLQAGTTSVKFESLALIDQRYHARYGYGPSGEVTPLDNTALPIPSEGLLAFRGARFIASTLSIGQMEYRVHQLARGDPLMTIRFKIGPFEPEIVFFQRGGVIKTLDYRRK
ncbi:MAG: hypothetical protein WC858_02995 [Parcubacteria group bacterium]|jgi:hypothetical protein